MAAESNLLKAIDAAKEAKNDYDIVRIYLSLGELKERANDISSARETLNKSRLSLSNQLMKRTH